MSRWLLLGGDGERSGSSLEIIPSALQVGNVIELVVRHSKHLRNTRGSFLNIQKTNQFRHNILPSVDNQFGHNKLFCSS